MHPNQFDLLKTRRFLPIFVTQFLGAFNDNVFKNAVVILITYRIAEAAEANAQLLVTLAAGIFILPFFLFSATAGQLADKYEKSSLIAKIKFAEIVLMILASLGFFLHHVPLLMVTLFLLGTQATFFGPLKYSILPDQLKENELIAGNGFIEAGTFLSILLGTMVGGLLILLPFGEYLISFIILLVSISGFISSLYILKTKSNPNLVVNFNFVQETIRVIQYSKEREDLFLCILGISWFWLIGAVFLAEFPVFTKDIVHGNEHVVTYFMAIFSIGIASGSLLCNKLLKGKVHATYVPLGALGMTLFIVDLYFASNALSPQLKSFISPLEFLQTWGGWRISFDLLFMSMCGGLYTVPLYAILQKRSDESHRARVIASNNVVNSLFMVIAAIGTIILLELNFTVNQVFLLLGIINALVAIYISKLLPAILIKSILRFIFQMFYQVKVVGLENYEKAGKRLVIVANHASFLDAALLAVYLPDKLTFAIDTQMASKWWIRGFLKIVNAYPMDPTNPMAIKTLIELVKEDRRCVIFPEGRLTMTGALMKIYEGPGLVADKSHAKLLPVRIEGAQFTPFSRLKGKVRIRLMPMVTITILPAHELALHSTLKGRARREQIGMKLYDLMTTMMFESSDYHQTLFTSLIDAKEMHGRSYKMMEDIERKSISYQQFITRSFVLGSQIAKQTESSENVGILLPNMISTAITFFAMQAYGRVPAMLNFSAGIKDVQNACHIAQIKTVYTSTRFIETAKLTEMVVALKQLGIHIIYLEDSKLKIGFFSKFKAFWMAQFPRLAYHLVNRLHPYDAELPAVILFTSGSEGTPKGVVLSHRNIQANRYQLSACVDFTATDKILNALPIFHSFGLSAGMLLPILSGIKVFFYPSPLHYRVVPQVSYDINATILFGTDTFLSGYAKYAHPYDFYSLRYVFSGAEKLKEQTLTTWANKFGVRIFEGYGATEASPVIATNTPMHDRVGTVGRLLPAINYQLKPAPGGLSGGVLWVSGPNIMKGYYLSSMPGILVPPEQGWYNTGDVVTMDEGYIRIIGRVKRFAKIGGEMVSLTSVEELVNTLWPHFQHAVISIPDPKKGEQLILVTAYPEANREALHQFAKEKHVSDIAIPKRIEIVKSLPLLGSGKVNYVKLNEIYSVSSR